MLSAAIDPWPMTVVSRCGRMMSPQAKTPGCLRHLVELVRRDQALAVVELFHALEVTGLADGGDDEIGLEVHLGARLLDRLAARVVELDHAQRLGAPGTLVDEDFDRKQAAMDLHALARASSISCLAAFISSTGCIEISMTSAPLRAAIVETSCAV